MAVCPLVHIHYNVAEVFSVSFMSVFSTVVLPHLHKLALCNNQQTVESKRIDIATQLFEAYSALSCCCILYVFLHFTPNCVCLEPPFNLAYKARFWILAWREYFTQICMKNVLKPSKMKFVFFIWTDLEKCSITSHQTCKEYLKTILE